MGYVVWLPKVDVTIPAHRHADALQALRELNSREDLMGGGHFDGKASITRHWSFTDPAKVQAADTLEEMLRALRFPVADFDDDGTITDVEFSGEKRGDDKHIWAALAPFVEPGGEMVWHGEDGRVWRWTFDGRRMLRSEGIIGFGPEEEVTIPSLPST